MREKLVMSSVIEYLNDSIKNLTNSQSYQLNSQKRSVSQIDFSYWLELYSAHFISLIHQPGDFNKDAMTFSITTLSETALSIMTSSIKGLFGTLSINDIQQKNTQHNKSATIPSVFMLSVAIYLLLC